MHTAQGGQQNPLGPRRTPHTRGMVLWITVCWTQNMTARDSRLLSDRRATSTECVVGLERFPLPRPAATDKPCQATSPHLKAVSTQPLPRRKWAGQRDPAGTVWRLCVCGPCPMLLGQTGASTAAVAETLRPRPFPAGGTVLQQTRYGLTVCRATQRVRAEAHTPSPMMPKVSPRILAAPEATSRICSTLWTRVPSRSAWCSQVVLRYRLRMWHMVESAVSSTDAAGTLQTAMPGDTRHAWAVTKAHPGTSPVKGWRTCSLATLGTTRQTQVHAICHVEKPPTRWTGRGQEVRLPGQMPRLVLPSLDHLPFNLAGRGYGHVGAWSSLTTTHTCTGTALSSSTPQTSGVWLWAGLSPSSQPLQPLSRSHHSSGGPFSSAPSLSALRTRRRLP